MIDLFQEIGDIMHIIDNGYSPSLDPLHPDGVKSGRSQLGVPSWYPWHDGNRDTKFSPGSDSL